MRAHPDHQKIVISHVDRFDYHGKSLTRLIVGPDGNIWFGSETPERDVGAIGRIDVGKKQVTTYPLPDGASPGSMVAGADGNVWFTYGNNGPSELATITPGGTITYFNQSDGLVNPIVGPDGEIWGGGCRSECEGYSQLARMTPQGDYTTVPLSFQAIGGFTLGPRKHFWICAANAIDEVATDGTVLNSYSTPQNGDTCGFVGTGAQIVYGPDGNIYSNAEDGLTRTTPDGRMTLLFTAEWLTQLQPDATDDAIWYAKGFVRGRTVPQIFERFLATNKTVTYIMPGDRRVEWFVVDHAHNSVWYSQNKSRSIYRAELQ